MDTLKLINKQAYMWIFLSLYKTTVNKGENLFSDCPLTTHTHPRGSGRQ